LVLEEKLALVLSGTPLENRLDELYSVVQFINARQLGPAFRFFHRHRIVDEKGRVLGYKNLDELRRVLGPILLRRTRAMVLRGADEVIGTRTISTVTVSGSPVIGVVY